MTSRALLQLHEDHAHISVLLDAIERETEATVSRTSADKSLLNRIVSYFQSYAENVHHPNEDLIYGHLVGHVPREATDIFDLVEDHRSTTRQTGLFERALVKLDVNDPESRAEFRQASRDFVAGQRAHLKSEEEHFFPAAEKWLKPDQWAEVERGAMRQTPDQERASRNTLNKLLSDIEKRISRGTESRK